MFLVSILMSTNTGFSLAFTIELIVEQNVIGVVIISLFGSKLRAFKAKVNAEVQELRAITLD